jgi:hypothetical protein
LIASVHPLVRNVPPPLRGAVFDRIFYSARHKFVYFRVPKAANSTIMLSLANAMEARAADDRGSAAKAAGKQNLKLPLAFESTLAGCYKFTFVRNPFSRVLSAYLDKVVSGNPKIRRYLGTDDRAFSFLEFLKRLEDGYLTANVHWAPQSIIVTLPPERLDFVGRVETLEADLRQVMSRVFGGTAENRIVQRSHGMTAASRRVDEMYGAEERRLVEKMYARDFELFYPNG